MARAWHAPARPSAYLRPEEDIGYTRVPRGSVRLNAN
jgi:hypothetical protein